MDLDSDEDKYRATQESEDEEEPRPPSLQREVTEAEMFLFLALTLQMGHTVQDRLKDYWTKMEQIGTLFYGQAMALARYCHILRFLHFTGNNRNGVYRTDDRLWKIRDLFEIIRTNFSKFYNPSEHLAVNSREGYYSNSTSRKNANVSASKCSNYVTLLDIHMT